MSEMRLNPLTGRWVTIVEDRAQRPTDFAVRDATERHDDPATCPFCPERLDNETALMSRHSGTDKAMTIVPNRYPAYEGDGGFAPRNTGPIYCSADGTGMHEVFVFTPEHDQTLDQLSDDQAGEFMLTLKERFAEHSQMPRIRYSQAIVNHGHAAGASIAHPHGQILGLPFVPAEVLDEERAFGRFAGGCLVCTTIEAESVDGTRVVQETDHTVTVAPYWSGTPYELLVMPRQHRVHLQQADDDVLRAVGVDLRDAIRSLAATLDDVPYNIGFHTAPHSHAVEYHWHIHVWPVLQTQAGFERGTGVLINVMPPEHAAESLRAAAASPSTKAVG